MKRLEDLLEKTSRTFALSIPVLPEPTKRQVMIAYLLFRIADTFEDAAHWPPGRRVEALREFQELLSDFTPAEAARLSAKWLAAGPSPNPGYRELVADVPFVLDAFLALDPAAVASVRAHVIHRVRGDPRRPERFLDQRRRNLLVLLELRDLFRSTVTLGLQVLGFGDGFAAARVQLAKAADDVGGIESPLPHLLFDQRQVVANEG